MTIAIFGGGLVGRRVARLALARSHQKVVLVGMSREPAPIAGVRLVTGWPSGIDPAIEVAVLAGESAEQPGLARRLLRRGVHVVSTADDLAAVQKMWSFDELARSNDASMIVGAGYSPGLSSVLVAWMVSSFDEVFDVSTASFGTGGPACARQHHRSMSATALEVRDGAIRRVRGGSGRSLVWFPEPVGGADCYRGGLAEPFLLHQAFPEIPRIQSRQAATRRDRLTARLPMLRRPHAEGLVGGLWIEVRGVVGGRVDHRVVGVTGANSTGAAHTAAALAESVVAGSFPTGAVTPAMISTPELILRRVTDAIKLWSYDGSTPPHQAASPIQAAKNWKVARPASKSSLTYVQFRVSG